MNKRIILSLGIGMIFSGVSGLANVIIKTNDNSYTYASIKLGDNGTCFMMKVDGKEYEYETQKNPNVNLVTQENSPYVKRGNIVGWIIISGIFIIAGSAITIYLAASNVYHLPKALPNQSLKGSGQ